MSKLKSQTCEIEEKKSFAHLSNDDGEDRIQTSADKNSIENGGTQMENRREMLNAEQVADILGISISYGYKIINQLNRELEKAGYLTIHGKVDSLYLNRRLFPAPEKIISIEN